MKRLVLLCLLALPACTQTAAPPPAGPVSPVTPTSFRLPEGSGCAGEVARFRAVMQNDLATGHVAKSVYDRVNGEIDQAAAACAAGRDAEAVRLVRASKARHGYP